MRPIIEKVEAKFLWNNKLTLFKLTVFYAFFISKAFSVSLFR